jgi:hypothetical protein
VTGLDGAEASAGRAEASASETSLSLVGDVPVADPSASVGMSSLRLIEPEAASVTGTRFVYDPATDPYRVATAPGGGTSYGPEATMTGFSALRTSLDRAPEAARAVDAPVPARGDLSTTGAEALVPARAVDAPAAARAVTEPAAARAVDAPAAARAFDTAALAAERGRAVGE